LIDGLTIPGEQARDGGGGNVFVDYPMIPYAQAAVSFERRTKPVRAAAVSGEFFKFSIHTFFMSGGKASM